VRQGRRLEIVEPRLVRKEHFDARSLVPTVISPLRPGIFPCAGNISYRSINWKALSRPCRSKVVMSYLGKVEMSY
jgi:hypothetical protein